MLPWLDRHPVLYWWVASVALAAVSIVALRVVARGHPPMGEPRSDRRWGWAIFALLIAGRWPTFFVTRDLNPDESQLLAGAITLRHDPMFWRSVDGGTAGPFDFYALLPAGWLVGADSYASARLTALLLLGAALLFAHQLLAARFGRALARVATLGAITFEAFTLHPDFLHYSTELVPICLLSAALYLGWRRDQGDASSLPVGIGLGALLGAVPLAKLQAGPLAAVCGLWLLIEAGWQPGLPWARRWQRALALVGGACIPEAFFAVLLTLTGEWENAIIPYLLHNISYVNAAIFSPGDWAAQMLGQLSRPGTGFVAWAAGALAGAGWAGWFLARQPALPRKFVPLLLFSALLLVTATACIYLPRRPFSHYLQLSVIPAVLFVGAVAGTALESIPTTRHRRRATLLAGLFAVTVLPLVWARAPVPHPDVGRLQLFQSSPLGAVAREVLRYARPGDSLGVWGWSTNHYAETGLRQATRDAFSQAEIVDHPYYDYFRQRYLADFTLNRPAVFLDASAGGAVSFPSQPLSHDALFPALGVMVQDKYQRVPDVGSVRVYVRKDRL